MATFTEYLRFSDKMEYIDKQVKVIGEVNISKEIQERLASIGKEINMMVFAHPECPDSLRVVGILEAMRKYIPHIEIDYRKRSIDKELLLQYSPEGKIPTIFLIDGIKFTRVFSEYPESLKKAVSKNTDLRDSLVNSFHNGGYDEDIIENLLLVIE